MVEAAKAVRDGSESPAGATRRELLETLARLRGANEALVEENARLRRDADATTRRLASFPLLNPNPVLEIDPAGTALFCNPAAEAVLESLGLGVDGARAFLPDEPSAVVRALRERVAGAGCREVTLRGRTFAEHLFLAPEGTVRVYAYEVTEQARARSELAAGFRRVSSHLENSPLAVVEFDAQFRVIRWAGQAERMFGWRAEEVLGRSVAELRWVYEEDAESVRRETEALLSGEKPSGVQVNRNRRRDGSVILCEWHNSAIYDGAGALASVLSHVLDITERHEAEAALRRSVARLELLAATASELLLAPEPQKAVEALCTRVLAFLGCHVFFNYLVDEAAGGLRLNACAGIPAEEAARIGTLAFGVAVCGCVARDGARIVAERVQTAPDERTALVRSYGVRAYACHPLLGPGGAVLGTLSFGTRDRDRFDEEELSLMKAVTDLVATAMIRVRDTAALRESRDELQRNLAALAAVNAELESFVYSVSHDLREPVRTVGGFAQMVLAQQADRLDARGADYLRRIARGAERMSRLIEDLLHLSRVSRQRIDRVAVDLSAIAAAVVAELREGAPERAVDVEIEPGLRAVADRGLLEIALRNLLSNAWKFTSRTAGARIRVGARPCGPRTEYFVADNGVGFDPAYAGQLFQPFHRLHAEREYAGTGIGLALVERAVVRHGGEVRAEGRPGGGAEFAFTLGAER